MDSFPIFLNLSQAVPLVIGDGHLAVAKVRTLLLRAGRVDVMCNSLPLELQKFALSGKVKKLPMIKNTKNTKDKKKWEDLLAGRPLVAIDPSLTAVIELLHPICLQRGLPINVADNIEKSSFAFGAMVDRRPLTVAIATDGIVPVLATDIRQKLEQAIPTDVGVLMSLARQYRHQVSTALPMGLKRRLFWQEFLHGSIAQLVRGGNMDLVAAAVGKTLADLANGKHKIFRHHNNIFLLGLRPNHAVDDLSLAMLQTIKNADTLVVVGDGVIFSDMLSLARREVIIKKINPQSANRTAAPTPTISDSDLADMVAWLQDGQSVVVLTMLQDYDKVKNQLEVGYISVYGFKSIYEKDNGEGNGEGSGVGSGEGSEEFHQDYNGKYNDGHKFFNKQQTK